MSACRGRIVAAIAALTLSGASCRDLASPLATECVTHDRIGQFAGRVSGVVSDTLVGCAYYGIQSGTTGMVFTKGGPKSADRVKLFKGGSYRVGVHTVGHPDDAQPYGTVYLGLLRFPLKSGSVTISDNGAGFLTGAVDFVAVSESGDTIFVRGDFFARCFEGTADVPLTDNVIQDPSRKGLCNPFPPGAGLRLP